MRYLIAVIVTPIALCTVMMDCCNGNEQVKRAFPASQPTINPFPAQPTTKADHFPIPTIPPIKMRIFNQGHYWNWDTSLNAYRPEGNGWMWNSATEHWWRYRLQSSLPMSNMPVQISSHFSAVCAGRS